MLNFPKKWKFIKKNTKNYTPNRKKRKIQINYPKRHEGKRD